jgi:DNA-binding XRE family transcriptional regulator
MESRQTSKLKTRSPSANLHNQTVAARRQLRPFPPSRPLLPHPGDHLRRPAPVSTRPDVLESQEEFAHICGLDRTYIGGIERGERNVALVNIEKIAKALKISLPKLFHKV